MPTANSYTHVRFVGHAIRTAPSSVWKPGKVCVHEYYGITPTTEDIRQRALLVGAVLDAAAQHIASEHTPADQHTLNVLVLPEFYFRGAQGVYSPKEEAQLQTALRALIKASKWSDWVCMFGTYLSGWKRPNTADPNDMMVNNVSLVHRGGFGDDYHGYCHCVTKEHMSSFDFIADGKGLTRSEANYIDLAKTGVGMEQAKTAIDGRGIFQMLDVSFGVEICLDHNYNEPDKVDVRRLWHSPQAKGMRTVQLHVVPSCGMSLKPASIVAVEKGWAFNVDGASDTGTTTLRQVTTANSLIPPVLHESGPGAAATLGDVVDPATKISVSTLIANKGVEIDKLYANGAGELHIYAPVALPASSVVT